jgi:hypothetical protein
MVVNKKFVLDHSQLKNNIYPYLIANFQQRLMADRNPLMRELQNDLYFYKIN